MTPAPPPATARAAPLDGLARWLAGWRGNVAVGLALVATGWALSYVPGMRSLDLAVLDAKFAVLARHAPLPRADDIAIVGIDDASLAAVPEPIALYHRALGRALTALAAAKPRAVGLDVVLPERSFDAFAPGSDAALAAGLIALKRVAPIIAGVTTHDDGTLRRVHPPLLAAAGATGQDVALLPLDDDGRIRRFDDRLGANGEQVATLVGRLTAIGGQVPTPGRIQYALGNGFGYVPLADVIAWHEAGDTARLAAAFGGKYVLVGSVLPHDDLKRQPVPLARGSDSLDVPGVYVHAQALATQLAGASIRPAPAVVQLLLLVLAASLWFVPTWRLRIGVFAVLGVFAFALSLWLLRGGVELPLGAAARVALTATAARSALEAWRVRRDRARLTALFGGYVSPAVLQAILAGRLEDDARRGRRGLCFLFADIRGFVALSATVPPEDVLALLNRYFAAVTPALHEHGGTVDNFRGDGLMAVFGAPARLDNPAGAGVAAAHAMFAALAALNRELVAEGSAPLAIGVTLACGDAVVGNVGSPERYNYTAIGDAANVAARLQEVAKARGYPLVATAEVVERAGRPSGREPSGSTERAAAATGGGTTGGGRTGSGAPGAAASAAHRWTPLGDAPVRDHAAVAVFGWRPGA